MTAPAFGIGYSFWLRGRFALGAAWVVVLGLAAAVKLLPFFTAPIAVGAGLDIPFSGVVLAVLAVLVPALALLNVLTYGPIDLSATETPMPLHVRILPLSNRALVGWPMLFAIVTLGSLWLVLYALVLEPAGLETSLAAPTAFLIACTLWTQTVAWIPLPLRFLRIALFFVVVGVPLGLTLRNVIVPEDHAWFVAELIVWAALAYPTAVLGLTRARRGGVFDRAARSDVAASSASAAPFRSAAAARRWYETRRNTSFFMTTFGIVACVLVGLSALSLVVKWLGSIPSSISITFLVLGPPLITAVMGGWVGRFDFWKRPGMAAFFALRPMTTAQMVADKLVAATRAAVIMVAWCIPIAGFAYWSFVAILPPTTKTHVEAWVRGQSLFDVALLVLGYAFVLWRSLAVDLWTTMTGRAWPSRVVATYTAVAFCGSSTAFALIHSNPAFEQELLAALPTIAGAVVALKLALGAAAAVTLRRRALVSSSTLLAFAAGWCVFTAAGCALVAHFVHLSWTLGCIVALTVPLGRVGLAVLALDANRHA